MTMTVDFTEADYYDTLLWKLHNHFKGDYVQPSNHSELPQHPPPLPFTTFLGRKPDFFIGTKANGLFDEVELKKFVENHVNNRRKRKDLELNLIYKARSVPEAGQDGSQEIEKSLSVGSRKKKKTIDHADIRMSTKVRHPVSFLLSVPVPL